VSQLTGFYDKETAGASIAGPSLACCCCCFHHQPEQISRGLIIDHSLHPKKSSNMSAPHDRGGNCQGRASPFTRSHHAAPIPYVLLNIFVHLNYYEDPGYSKCSGLGSEGFEYVPWHFSGCLFPATRGKIVAIPTGVGCARQLSCQEKHIYEITDHKSSWEADLIAPKLELATINQYHIHL
jgi:hypothetical protein